MGCGQPGSVSKPGELLDEEYSISPQFSLISFYFFKGSILRSIWKNSVRELISKEIPLTFMAERITDPKMVVNSNQLPILKEKSS